MTFQAFRGSSRAQIAFTILLATSIGDGDEKRVHGSNAKEGHLWWELLLLFSSRLPDKVLLHQLISIFTSMLRIMKSKVREARRLGKVSGSMFDREEGAFRQRRFLKDQRDQWRWGWPSVIFLVNLITHLQTATSCISCCRSPYLKLILVPLRRDRLLLGKEESESHCRMEPGFVRPRAAVTTSGSGNKKLNSSDIYSTYWPL